MTRARTLLATLSLLLAVASCQAPGSQGNAVGVSQQAITAAVSTDKSSYAVGETIRVDYAGLSGAGAKDWIGISKSGEPDTIWWRFQYTAGASSGTFLFTALPPGTWVARAFIADSFSKVGESAPFDITGPAPAITTNGSAYPLNGTVTADFSGFPGNDLDFIGLVRVGTGPNHGVEEWYYLNTATSGQLTFRPTAGTFELRGCFNGSWNRIATSAPFTVGGTVSTDKGSYTLAESIVVSWSGFPGDPADWVAIAAEGSSVNTYVVQQPTGGAVAGVATFGPLPAGRYRARGYFAGSYSLIAESATFVVANTVTVATDRASYTQAQPVTTTWTGLPGTTTDWIGVVATSAPSTIVTFYYTGGAVNGTHDFTGLPQGSYRARAFTNNSFVPLAESAPFSISAASITTDSSTYTSGTPVTVSYAGLPGNARDWIGISPSGSSPYSYVQFQYTGGARSGTATFNGLAPGNYVARAYVDDGFSILLESTPFTVN